LIIALEGIDACGKSSQIAKLRQWFEDEKGYECKVFSYPNYESETGLKIREMLKGGDADPLTLQSLMTVNRLEDTEKLWKYESGDGRCGPIAILDRYWWSGYAYGLFDGLDPSWLQRIHRGVTCPDLWVVLDISAEESFRRRPIRDDAYESDVDRLRSCRSAFLDLATDTNISMVCDGTKSPGEITHAILNRTGLG